MALAIEENKQLMSKNINPRINKIVSKPPQFSVDDYVQGIIKGDRNFLSRAISLLESSRDIDKKTAEDIISRCLSHSGKSQRIGITGVPGVGKSSFINIFGKKLIEQGHKVAILAIDPSSSLSGGSILGDKTRMTYLSGNDKAFIRPSPTAGTLGGVAAKTRETMLLCEAAGYDRIIIETVGVGQSETSVASMVDVFVLLTVAGTGDELQGIKRGIMEMTDILIFTKDDGDNHTRTEIAKSQFENALMMFPPKPSQWYPKVLSISSLEEKGFEKVIDTLSDYFTLITKNSFFLKNRDFQLVQWFNEQIENSIKQRFYNDSLVKTNIEEIKNKILQHKLSPISAANALIDLYFKNKK